MSSISAKDANHHANAQDVEILARVAQGEQAALGELYDRWSLPLQTLVAASLTDPELIEDVLHNTFITLWQKANDFDPKQGTAYAWAATWVQSNLADFTVNESMGQLVSPDALAPPSDALRARIINSAVPLPSQIRYVLPFPTPPAWLGWAAAALFGLTAIFFAAKSFNVRGELQTALVSERVSHVEAVTLKNLLEAERILSRAQLDRLIVAERQINELRAQIVPTVAPLTN